MAAAAVTAVGDARRLRATAAAILHPAAMVAVLRTVVVRRMVAGHTVAGPTVVAGMEGNTAPGFFPA